MIQRLVRKMKMLSQEKRHMLVLFWIYEFANIIVGIFIGAFVFLETQSIGFLALYILVRLTGSLTGFAGVGYMIAQLQLSMRRNYLHSFVMFFAGFVWLAVMPAGMVTFLVFAFLNGLGLGIFWLGNHSYEMVYTKNSEGDRDFYSSVEQGGTQILSIIAPLMGTLLALLSENVFHIQSLTLLFWFLPIVFLMSLPFLFWLPDYTPPKVSGSEVRSFFTRPHERTIKWYYIFTASVEFRAVAVVLFSVMALETLVRIGTWETIVSVVSFCIIFILAERRRAGNRVRIMFWGIIGFYIAFGLLFFSHLSVYLYLAFSLLMVIFKPMYRVSQHAIDLYSMDLLAENRSSFYSGMLFREVVLYAGRIIVLGSIIALSFFVKDIFVLGRVIIILYLVSVTLYWFIARSFIKEHNLHK